MALKVSPMAIPLSSALPQGHASRVGKGDGLADGVGVAVAVTVTVGVADALGSPVVADGEGSGPVQPATSKHREARTTMRFMASRVSCTPRLAWQARGWLFPDTHALG